MEAKLVETPQSKKGMLIGFFAGLATAGAAYLGLEELNGGLSNEPSNVAPVGLDPAEYEHFFRTIGTPVTFKEAIYEHSPLFTADRDENASSHAGQARMPARRFFLFTPRFGVKEGRNIILGDRSHDALEPLTFACPERATLEQVQRQLVAVCEVGRLLNDGGIKCFGEWKIGIEDQPSRISFQFPHGDTIKNAEVRFSIENATPLQLAPYLQIGNESFTPQVLADISLFMQEKEQIALQDLRNKTGELQRYTPMNLSCEWHIGVEQRGNSLILIQNIVQRRSNGQVREISSAVFQGQESVYPRRFNSTERFTAHLVTDFEVVTQPSNYFIVTYTRSDMPGQLTCKITHCEDAEVFICWQAHEDGLREPSTCAIIEPLQPLSTKRD
ncbi:MAG: hypothetical protein K1X79_05690 [Oligoflexia bacterium]|nr:hypothetical protein [Oligoflexia bacterium]